MLTVQLPSSGRVIKVIFRRRTEGMRTEAIEHSTRDRLLPANANYKGKATKGADRKITECEITSPSEQTVEQEALIGPVVLARATVVWNPNDRYVKRDGQRKAMTAALEYLTELGLTTKADREAIWAKWMERGPSQPPSRATVLDVNGVVMTD